MPVCPCLRNGNAVLPVLPFEPPKLCEDRVEMPIACGAQQGVNVQVCKVILISTLYTKKLRFTEVDYLFPNVLNSSKKGRWLCPKYTLTSYQEFENRLSQKYVDKIIECNAVL